MQGNVDRTFALPKSGHDLLNGDSEVRSLMRAVDWAKTPLGPPDFWPQSLRAIVRVMLTSRFAMWMAWGPDLTFLCNDAYLPTVGIKRDWVIGSRSDVVWAEIWKDIGPRIDHVLKTEKATWDEALLLYLERSGFTEETYHTFSYSPLFDDAGKTSGMLCVVAEVTEKVIGERQLALLRDLGTRLAFATSRSDVMTSLEACLCEEPRDLPFALTYLTHGEARTATLSALHGLRPTTPFTPHLIDITEDSTPWHFQRTGDRATIEVPIDPAIAASLATNDLPTLPQRALVSPLTSSGESTPVGYLVAALNPNRRWDEGYRGFIELLTGQVAAAIARADAFERERSRAEALAEIDRAKTAFFSNVSHEFRTPLTLMLGPLEDILATDAVALSDLREPLDVAHRNALRLLRLVNSLLDFSRIEAGRVDVRFEPTDLAALTADLASSFRSATDRAGLRLVVSTPPLSQLVCIDRDMWETIVLNLLSNAFKFTFEGEIAIELGEKHGCVELTVRDTGTGIPEHELPRLFERFHRVEGARGRSFEGTGIGLALVQELVKLHGGEVIARSEVGRGTTFVVSIPTNNKATPHIDEPSSGAPALKRHRAFVEEALQWLPDVAESIPEGGGTGGPFLTSLLDDDTSERRRILLADDNADLRTYISRLLTERGYVVTAATNGQEALRAMRASRPDLLVTDIMMPELDGFGLLRAVRDDPTLRDLPVILLSARAGDEAKIEGLDTGADDYLTKPFSARELLARVAANIAMARLRRESADAVHASNSRAARVLDGMTEGYLLLDRSFRVMEINKQGLRFDGRSREELIGRTHWEAWPDTEDTAQAQLYKQVMSDGTSGSIETQITWPGGRESWFDINAYAVPDGLAIFFRDVTVRRQAEDRLRELNETLELRVSSAIFEREQAQDALRQAQKMEAMGQLTGGVAHDFNNLLTPIVAALDTLQRRGVGGEREQRLISGAAQAAERAKLLVQRLLAFARRQPLQPVPVDVAHLIRGMAELIASTTGPQIKVVVDVAGNMPPANADANQLEMALLNLSVNARDAMPNGGTLRLSAHTQRIDHGIDLKPGNYICVSVSDTGSGMDETTLARAVEPFFSTKGIGKGTGLGLSMVHGLASQLGGALAIRSAIGVGTNVELWLPESSAEPRSPQGKSDSVPASASRGTALLIDDEATVRLTTADMLQEMGYAVVEAASADEAVKLMRRGDHFDIVVTDHLMPGMTGSELAHLIRAEMPTIRVILISGYSEVEGIDPTLPRLTKPFRNDELAIALAQLTSC